MRNAVQFVWLIFGCLMLTTIFSFQPKLVMANEKEMLMPLDLDHSKWAIEITPVGENGKKKTKSDTLVFEDDQFYSEEYRDKGFDPTNYTASLSANGMTEFKTMQNKDGDTAYWEGRIKKEAIGGSIYLYSKKGNKNSIKNEYYFKGMMLSGDLKPKVKKNPVPPPPAPPAPKGDSQSVGSGEAVLKKAKEAVNGAVEKVRDLVNPDGDGTSTLEAD